ncbi:MAG: hypothetical protein ACPL3C_08545 [Pyrobaculum sp.]
MNGTAAVYYYQPGLAYAPATPHEDSSVYMYLQQLCRFAAVKPLNLTYTDGYTYVYAANIYCSPDGIRWAWLRWLPLRLTAFRGNVTFVRINATAYTAVGVFNGTAPEGWYSDGAKAFRLPEQAGEAGGELERLRREAAALRAEAERLRAELAEARAAANATARRAAQAEAEAEELRQRLRQTADLLAVCRNQVAQLTSSLGATKAELERAAEREAQLRREAEALSRALEGNRTRLAELEGMVADLEKRLADAETDKWVFLGLGLTAAGVATAITVLAKRREAV